VLYIISHLDTELKGPEKDGYTALQKSAKITHLSLRPSCTHYTAIVFYDALRHKGEDTRKIEEE
jgi:hypothetical protein